MGITKKKKNDCKTIAKKKKNKEKKKINESKRQPRVPKKKHHKQRMTENTPRGKNIPPVCVKKVLIPKNLIVSSKVNNTMK